MADDTNKRIKRRMGEIEAERAELQEQLDRIDMEYAKLTSVRETIEALGGESSGAAKKREPFIREVVITLLKTALEGGVTGLTFSHILSALVEHYKDTDKKVNEGSVRTTLSNAKNEGHLVHEKGLWALPTKDD